jgi:uncharacterized protein YjaZ
LLPTLIQSNSGHGAAAQFCLKQERIEQALVEQDRQRKQELGQQELAPALEQEQEQEQAKVQAKDTSRQTWEHCKRCSSSYRSEVEAREAAVWRTTESHRENPA